MQFNENFKNKQIKTSIYFIICKMGRLFNLQLENQQYSYSENAIRKLAEKI
nr:MAG TPA: hypothetical protein [Caudoviricetes sp.]